MSLGRPVPVLAKDISSHIYVIQVFCQQTSGPLGSQGNPFTGTSAIQDAIDSASNGDTIHVGKGTYGSIVFPLYGTSIIDLEVIAEDWSSCDAGDAVIDGTGQSSQTGVTIQGRQTSATLFKGFVVQNWNPGLPGGGGGGCGIRITTTAGGSPNGYGCSPTIDDCLIKDNSTYSVGSVYGGAGMQIAWYCNPTVKNCVFDGNFITNATSTGYGGGIWIYGAFINTPECSEAWENEPAGAELKPDPLITDCTFIDNTATNTSSGAGGGIAITCGISHIMRCTFTGNTAAHGGGAIYGHLCDGTLIEKCTFEENSATDDGGAIYIEGKSEEDDGFERVHLILNQYVENSATEGGAIYIVDKDVTISHSEFAENVAQEEGAALWCGAERDEDLNDPYEIYHICNLYWGSVVRDSTGDGEAAIYVIQELDAEQLEVTSFNNTIAGNTDVRGVTLVNNEATGFLVFDCANEIIYSNSSTLTNESIHEVSNPSDLIVYGGIEQSYIEQDGSGVLPPMLTPD